MAGAVDSRLKLRFGVTTAGVSSTIASLGLTVSKEKAGISFAASAVDSLEKSNVNSGRSSTAGSEISASGVVVGAVSRLNEKSKGWMSAAAVSAG